MFTTRKVPEVSILMPVHGNAPFLKETIKSVEEQSLDNFEFIIILDRVGDATKTLLNEKAKLNHRIKIIRSKSPGISSALNFGLNHCESNYVARIDSDDLMHPQRLKLQKLYLDRHATIDCVGSQIIKINANSRTIGRSYLPEMPAEISDVLLFRNCIAHPSVMFRKSTVISIGGYRSEFDGCEDFDLWLRMDNGNNLKNMEIALTSYRIWPKQTTNIFSDDLLCKLKRTREIKSLNLYMPYWRTSMNWLNSFYSARNKIYLQACTSLDTLTLSMKPPRNLLKTVVSIFKLLLSCCFIPFKAVRLLYIIVKYALKYTVIGRTNICK